MRILTKYIKLLLIFGASLLFISCVGSSGGSSSNINPDHKSNQATSHQNNLSVPSESGSPDGSTVGAVVVESNVVYVSTYLGNVWEESNPKLGWQLVGTSSPGGGQLTSLAISGESIYTAGLDTQGFSYVWAFSDNTWKIIGKGPLPQFKQNHVNSISVLNNNVYAAGYESTGGYVVVSRNGGDWANVAGESSFTGPGGFINSVVAVGNDVYAGGFNSQTNAGDVWVSRNGGSWSHIGSQSSPFGQWGAIYSVAVSGESVYAGGYQVIGKSSIYNYVWVSRNNESWSKFGGESPVIQGQGHIYSLAVSGESVYAGGFKESIGKELLSEDHGYVWVSSGNGWNRYGHGGMFLGHDGEILSIAVDGKNVYAAGDFAFTGYVWFSNGNGWSKFGGTNALETN